jgi:parallel beta-helix repeat protein
MNTIMSLRYFTILLFTAFTSLQWLSAQSWIVSTAPHAGRTNVPFDTSISVTFDRDMDASSFTNATVKLYGSKTGRREGMIQYSAAGRTLTVIPERPFTVGESVTMILTKDIKGINQVSMNRSYQFSYIIKPKKITSGNFFQTEKNKTKYWAYILRSADMNNDGKIDLTLTSNFHLTVLKNQGSGVFQSDSMGVNLPLTETAIADFNNDGYLDVSAITKDGAADNAVYIFQNLKNGTLKQDTVIRFDSAVSNLVAKDFDGDGSIDIAIAHYSSKSMEILINNGSGSFTNGIPQTIPQYITGMVAEDWNSDGYCDVAVSSAGERSVTLLMNSGNGSFTAMPKHSLIEPAADIFSGDLDGDYLPDIMVLYYYDNPYIASVLKNLGDGSVMQTSVLSSSGYPQKGHLSDWNGDGKLDLAVTFHESASAVKMFLNDGVGNFTIGSDLKFNDPYPSITSADFSLSGSNDLAVYNASNPGYVYFFKSKTAAQSIHSFNSSINFLPINPGDSTTLWLKLMNIGTSGTLNLTNVSINDTSISIQSFPASIAPGATDSIALKYTPTKYSSLIDTLTIFSNDALHPILKIPVTASTGTSISGVITGNTTWTKTNSPYVITGLTVIDNGATVTISPGVKLIIQNGAIFNVDGTLNINGTKNDTILITSTQPGLTTFTGINIRSTGRLSIAYTIVEYADVGIKAALGSTITNAHHLLFRYNGIGMEVLSTVNGSFITAYENGTGIRLWQAKISNSFSDVNFYDNSIGIDIAAEIFSVANGSFENNGIGINGQSGDQNYSNLKFNGNGAALYVHNAYPTLNIRNCEFTENSQYGIGVSGANIGSISNNVITGNHTGIDGWISLEIKDNIITNNELYGIDIVGGALIENNTISNSNYGIRVRDGSSPTLRYNTISNNFLGGILHENAADEAVYTMNNIYANGNYDLQIKSKTAGTINAIGNYWGTTKDSIIQLHIYDYYDDGLSTKVNYKPFALKRVAPYGDHEPSISITPVSGVKSGIVSIAYQLTDIEQEILHCRYYYSLNGNGWTVIPGTDTAGIPFAKYRGTFLWKSREVLDGYTGNVYVKIIPSDKYLAGAYDSVKISLDNNYAPSASIQSSTGEKRVTGYFKNAVSVQYSISDPESDSVSFLCSFRIDSAGSEWKQASGVIVGGKSKPGNGSIVWTTANESLTVPGKYYFRITPLDIKSGLPDSILLSIDPIGIPAISLNHLQNKEYSGDITFFYTIIHDQNDTISLLPEYLAGSDGWKKATVLQPTVLTDSLQYSGSILWNSSADLQGMDIPTVQFRITPVRIVKGFSDILDSIHIDNNAVPSILSIIVPAEKISGSHRIPVLISDAENDSLLFRTEYSVIGTSVWKKATISSAVQGNDTSFIQWVTSADLFNSDVNVMLRITPMDNDTGNTVTGSVFRVDNLSGPILITAGSAMFTNDTMTIAFDRPIIVSSAATAVTVMSRSSGSVPFTAVPGSTSHQFKIIPSVPLTAADTLIVSIKGDQSTGLKDSLGNPFDGNKNGDLDGSPADDLSLSFNTGILGDYDLNAKFTIDDILLFRSVWNAQDKKREIGPASSQPPRMVVQADGKIDFEDLMVFVQNWNWRMNNSPSPDPFLMNVKKKKEEQGIDSSSLTITPIPLRSSGSAHLRTFPPGTERLVLTYTGEIDPAGFGLTFRYDPSSMRILNVSDEHVFDDVNGGKTLWLVHDDTLRGIYSAAVVNMGPIRSIRDHRILQFDAVRIGENPATIEITGDILTEDAVAHKTVSRFIMSEKKILPDHFDLAQNYPNPFNPSTMIEYQIPNESYISLKVYNMLGQEVAVLAEGVHVPGYYFVQWNASKISSGVYIYRLETKGFVQTRKMLLMK